MADCHAVIKYYENMSTVQLTELWNKFHKKGPVADVLRDILLFYFYHKQFPPVMQKSCDTLFSIILSRNSPKKQKNIICQVIEEVSVCLESSIVEQITFSSPLNVPSDLLNCILVRGLISLLEESTIDKLFSALRQSDVALEEQGKHLIFLLAVWENYPTLISDENISRLGALMDGWLRHEHNKITGSASGFFSRSDSCVATEVDGTNAGEIYSVLTLVNNFSPTHMMAIHSFSTIRQWFNKKFAFHNSKYPEILREYCSVIAEQCLRPSQKESDMNLQKAVLCEILDVMNQIVQLDISQAPQCLIIVKRIQNNVMEHFKGNHSDVFIFTRVLTFFLKFGQSTGYNSLLLCEYFLNDMIYRSFTSGLSALEIIIFLVENNNEMDASQKLLLHRFSPNILKLVACHPCVVIEEILELLPAMISPENSVELLHRIIDLPLLSATLSIHQAPALVQADSSRAMDVQWSTLLQRVRSSECIHAFNYLISNETGQEFSSDRMLAYITSMSELRSHNLVITCSQIVPLMCDALFSSLARRKDASLVGPVVHAIFHRLELVYDVPNYAASLHKCILEHLKLFFKVLPSLIFLLQSDIIEYISALKNYEKFPLLFIHMIYSVGEYSCNSESNSTVSSQISQYYEVLECLIYEKLAHFATREPVSLQLMNVMCSALSKLAAKCQDQIPRAVLCLNKTRSQVLKSKRAKNEESSIVCDRIEELLCLLQNPSVASLVWSSPLNPQMTSFVQVLGHITDS